MLVTVDIPVMLAQDRIAARCARLQIMRSDSSPRVTRHDDRGRYELDIDGEVVAFADFSVGDELITIPYIETAVEHRGKGYSVMLMDGVIDDLRSHGARVRATCPVARGHIAASAPELLVR
jgi:predicted GNAT family acetyltransferase